MRYLPGALLFVIPIVAIVAGVIVTWIRAKHGLLETTDQINKTLQTELAQRDETIAELRKRIEVLERIATDDNVGANREFTALKG